MKPREDGRLSGDPARPAAGASRPQKVESLVSLYNLTLEAPIRSDRHAVAPAVVEHTSFIIF